jgi:hypothetical protein
MCLAKKRSNYKETDKHTVQTNCACLNQTEIVDIQNSLNSAFQIEVSKEPSGTDVFAPVHFVPDIPD